VIVIFSPHYTRLHHDTYACPAVLQYEDSSPLGGVVILTDGSVYTIDFPHCSAERNPMSVRFSFAFLIQFVKQPVQLCCCTTQDPFPDVITGLAVSPNGRYVAAMCENGMLVCMSAAFDTQMFELDTHAAEIPQQIAWCGEVGGLRPSHSGVGCNLVCCRMPWCCTGLVRACS
jgi:hypothetical protein